MEMVLFIGGVVLLAVVGQIWAVRRRAQAVPPAEDVIEGEQVGLDYLLRWGEAQEVVEQSGYQGNQYRTWTEVQTRDFVEVQVSNRDNPPNSRTFSAESAAGRALRITTLAEPQRTLARALDGADVHIFDDRVRISWRDGMKDLDEQRRRALLLFVVLRHTGSELIKQIEGLAKGADRSYVLGHALTHLHTQPHIEAVARHVTPSDPSELRLAAALLLDRADEALELALEDMAPTLRLRAFDRFGEADPTRADQVLQRLLLQPEERRGVLGRMRALPIERAVALLEPVCQNLETDALRLLAELAPDVALPHLRAMANRESNPERRLRAARLLHPLEPGPAEAVLLELLQEVDWHGMVGAVVELGRLGTERAVQPLRALASHGDSEEVRDAATTSLAEVRSRLASRPAGALALSEETAGRLALVGEGEDPHRAE